MAYGWVAAVGKEEKSERSVEPAWVIVGTDQILLGQLYRWRGSFEYEYEHEYEYEYESAVNTHGWRYVAGFAGAQIRPGSCKAAWSVPHRVARLASSFVFSKRVAIALFDPGRSGSDPAGVGHGFDARWRRVRLLPPASTGTGGTHFVSGMYVLVACWRRARIEMYSVCPQWSATPRVGDVRPKR